jgi:hypothetical protein
MPAIDTDAERMNMDAQAQAVLDFWFLPPDNPDYGQ